MHRRLTRSLGARVVACAALFLLAAPAVRSGAESTASAPPPTPARRATLPAVSPDGKFVAYVSDRDSSTDLYVLEVASGGGRRLTRSPEPEGRPAWSADGRHVLFTVARGDTTLLLSVPASGGPATTLASVPGARSVRRSHDGRRLAVTRGGWTRNQLGVTLPDGKLYRALTDSSHAWWSPAWSPDDGLIAATRRDSSGHAQLVAVRSESGRTQELVRLPEGYGAPQMPAWSPDGKSLLFQAEVPRAEGQTTPDVHVFRLDLDSLKITRLGEHATPFMDEAPCWLDERTIVFQSSRSGAFELWTMTASGTLARQLTR